MAVVKRIQHQEDAPEQKCLRVYRRGSTCLGQDLPWRDGSGQVVHGRWWTEERCARLEDWRNNPLMQDRIRSFCDSDRDRRGRACQRMARDELTAGTIESMKHLLHRCTCRPPPYTGQELGRAREMWDIWEQQRARMARFLCRQPVREDAEKVIGSAASIMHLIGCGALLASYAMPASLYPPAGLRASSKERDALADEIGAELASLDARKNI